MPPHALGSGTISFGLVSIPIKLYTSASSQSVAFNLLHAKGGEKAYRLLAEAMAKSDRVALAKFVMRGKETLVLIRAAQGGLMLHTMYFADEVRDFGEIDKGASAKVREGELELAVKLLGELANDAFEPERYTDEYRQRVLDLVQTKVEGKEVVAAAPRAERGHVIDLMEALKTSLAERAASPKKPPAKMANKRPEPVPARKAAKR